MGCVGKIAVGLRRFQTLSHSILSLTLCLSLYIVRLYIQLYAQELVYQSKFGNYGLL